MWFYVTRGLALPPICRCIANNKPAQNIAWRKTRQNFFRGFILSKKTGSQGKGLLIFTNVWSETPVRRQVTLFKILWKLKKPFPEAAQTSSLQSVDHLGRPSLHLFVNHRSYLFVLTTPIAAVLLPLVCKERLWGYEKQQIMYKSFFIHL